MVPQREHATTWNFFVTELQSKHTSVENTVSLSLGYVQDTCKIMSSVSLLLSYLPNKPSTPIKII